MFIVRNIGIVVIFASFLLTGCTNTANLKSTTVMAEADLPLTVAILPFSKEADIPADEGPDWLLREVFFNYFSYEGYTDIPLEEVDRRLKKGGLTNAEAIKQTPPAELQKILGADAVINGHILAANNFTGGVYAETRIGATLDMTDLRTGEQLWEVEHTEIESSGILQSSVVAIVQDQVANLEVYEAYYKVAETFTNKVIDQVPDPALSRMANVTLPKIEKIQTNIIPDKFFATRDTIMVRIIGHPGLTAQFDIGSWKTGIPMKEVSPGRYEGGYQVKPEDQVDKALIIGSLKNKEGFIGKKVYRSASTQIIGNGV
ncbi:MAG: GNA1162 family protein [Nitrospinales bacterium]